GRKFGSATGLQSQDARRRLFQLDGGAGLLEFGFQFFGLLAVDALFDRARSGVDDGLRLFQAEAGRVADDFDDRDLLATDLRDDDVDGRRLFAATVRVTTAARGSGRSGRGDRGRGDAELLLQRFDALGEFEDGDAFQLLDPLSS